MSACWVCGGPLAPVVGAVCPDWSGAEHRKRYEAHVAAKRAEHRAAWIADYGDALEGEAEAAYEAALRDAVRGLILEEVEP